MQTFEASRHGDRRTDRGAVSFIMTMFVFFGIFLGVAAIAADLTATANRGQELQSAVDAAALAGVVAYEQELLSSASEALARAAAQNKAFEVLTQNGVDHLGNSLIDPVVTFPSVGGQVTVSVLDESVTTILGPIVRGVLPGEQKVQRNSTAEFLGCDACGVILPIPKPFKAVDADGDGDGFIPIEVGDRLYALNHNSDRNQIICVDTDAEEPCWREGDVDTAPFEINRDSYASSSNEPKRSPEMPHTGVVDGIIWWSASTATGQYLNCFNTVTDQPCSSRVQISDDPRGNEANMPKPFNEGGNAPFKDEARGGGTFAFGDLIFAFTDNHEIHCYDPAAATRCAGYDQRLFGGMPTGLDVFPDNEPLEGNHGGSIDRIVDKATGFVYSTIHIPGADVVDSLNCGSASVRELDADDLIDEIVVLENGLQYLAAFGIDNVQMTTDVENTAVRWRMTREPGSDDVYFESLDVNEWLDGEDDPSLIPSVLKTGANKVETDNAWILAPQPGGGFTMELRGAPDTFLNLTPLGAAIQEPGSVRTVWDIRRCTDPAREAGYAPGTWLHCYNTGVVAGSPGPCPDFESDSPLHIDGSRFSGRLWFDYGFAIPGTPAPKIAVCSSGLVSPYFRGLSSTAEIKCVDLATGDPDTTTNYTELATKITNEISTGPGAWGVPHYNAYQNRLIYPTQHNSGLVICWDFAATPARSCGEFIGKTPATSAVPNQVTEDYGYISKGNCVFALGHEEFFWAFQAGGAFGSECVGATADVDVKRCPCTGLASRWGVLDLSSIDLTGFDVLRLKVTTDPDDDDELGTLIWPIIPGLSPRDSWHELTAPANGSALINLDDILEPDPGTTFTDDSVRVVFYVEAPATTFGGSTVPQGEIRFQQQPHLVD